MPTASGMPSPGDPNYVAPTPDTTAATNPGTGTGTGLMNTTASPNPNPTATPAVPYTPINQPAPVPQPTTVPADKTVAGGVQSLIASDSPLMQQAQARAAAKMNERGLLNSSQAITAGQSAVLDAATPIAAADAQQATTLAVTDKQAATQKYTADLASNTQLQTQAVDDAFKTAYQTADTSAKLTLQSAHDAVTKTIADTEANYHTLMQSSASASDIYKSTLAAIANIYADTSLDANSKATTINGYLGWMKQSMNLIGSTNGVDLTGLTDFGTVSA